MNLKDDVYKRELRTGELFALSRRLFFRVLGWIVAVFLLVELPVDASYRFMHNAWYINYLLGLLPVATHAVLIVATNNALSSGEEGVIRIIFYSVKKLPWILLTYLFLLILMVLLGILLIIPAVIFFVYWVFIDQAVVLKGISPRKAFSYSMALVRDRWTKIFSLVMIFFGPTLVLGLLLIKTGFLVDHPMLSLISNALVFPFSAFQLILLTVAFVNLDSLNTLNKLSVKAKGSSGFMGRLRKRAI